jgi:hypothetical protein
MVVTKMLDRGADGAGTCAGARPSRIARQVAPKTRFNAATAARSWSPGVLAQSTGTTARGAW